MTADNAPYVTWRNMELRCHVCGDPKVRAKGRCSTCYMYLRRTGHDRPNLLLDRQVEREVARTESQEPGVIQPWMVQARNRGKGK